MTTPLIPFRALGAGLLALTLATTAAACSSSDKKDSGSAASGGGSYTVWDPYPQYDASSAWAKLVDKCGTDAGVTIKRTAYDTPDLTNKTLLAAHQGAAPDPLLAPPAGRAPHCLIADNPVVSTVAEAGVLSTTADTKTDPSKISPNLLAA